MLPDYKISYPAYAYEITPTGRILNNEYQLEVVAENERKEIVQVLFDNDYNLEELLYYSIILDDSVVYYKLEELGIKKLSGYRCNNVCGVSPRNRQNSYERADRAELQQVLKNPKDTQCLRNILSRLADAVDHKTINLYPSDLYDDKKAEPAFLAHYCNEDVFGLFIENTDILEKAKKWDMALALIEQGNATGVKYALTEKWFSKTDDINALLSLAQQNTKTNPELIGYLLEELNKKTDGNKNKNSLSLEDKSSASDMKKIWGTKKLEDGTLLITSYKGDSTEVHIPERIGKNIVSAIDVDAFNIEAPRLTPIQKNAREKIEIIEIPGTIKIVPNLLFKNSMYSFEKRKSSPVLRKVILNKGVEVIGGGAFSGCEALQEIDIPDTVIEIKQGAFERCTSLSSIELPKSISNLQSNLFERSGLIKFEMSDNVTECGPSLFEGCTQLISVTISNALSKIPAEMFMNCKSLKFVDIPEKVTEIGEHAFHSSGIEKCDIPISVNRIGHCAFCDCKDLISISIPEATELGVNCFIGCDRLNGEEAINSNLLVIHNTLQEYRNNDSDYCSVPLELPEIVKNISIGVWEKLPEIVYHPAQKHEIDEHEKIRIPEMGESVVFGRFPQTSDCQLLPLEWKVLYTEDDKALLITQKEIIALDGDSFKEDMGTWDKSKIREWLNRWFFEIAFTDKEQSIIVTASNTTPANPITSIDGGEDTEDRVFLLSYDEVMKFMPSEEDRKAEMTEYVEMQQYELVHNDEKAFWQTRTIGGKNGKGSMAIYNYNGYIVNDSQNALSIYTLRPAIWVQCDS